MTNSVYCATSLDGFIATKDGGVDWLSALPNPDENDYGYADFIETIDAIVMGRTTFEKVLSFNAWPYSKPVFVVSNALTKLPDRMSALSHGSVEIVSGGIRRIVSNLHEIGHHNLYVDGGLLIQSFLKEDLIDELTITRIPILLGEGIPLFGEIGRSLDFTHLGTAIFDNGLVQSTYRRKR